METQLQSLIADILGDQIPPEQISKENSTEWDSLNHLNLILALEEEFGIEIPPEDFSQLHSNYEFLVKYIKQNMN